MGSDPTRSTPPRIRVFGLDRQQRQELLSLGQAFKTKMHYSIWKGLSPSGGKRRTCNSRDCWPEESPKSIEKIPSRPTDGTLRLVQSQTRIKKSALELQINHNKQYKKMDSPAGKKMGFDLRRPPASGSERFVWNVLLLPELSDQPISYFRDIRVRQAQGSLINRSAPSGLSFIGRSGWRLLPFHGFIQVCCQESFY